MAGNGLNLPIQKLTMSVTEVMVIDTAASDSVRANLSGTSIVTGVLLHAANITNVSSIPIPKQFQQPTKVCSFLESEQYFQYEEHIVCCTLYRVKPKSLLLKR